MGAAGARLFRHQSGDSGHVEVRLGLVVGRSGDSIFAGGLRHRYVVDGDPAQHLVFDLHSVAGIEELAATEIRIAHLVWGWIEGALFDEDVRLGSLAVVLRGHLWLRSPEAG